jgi:hypothetical protein
VEGFSALLKKAQADRKVAGVGFGRDGPTITHLLFADVGIVFLEASKTNMESLRRVLAKYKCCSGQQVNLQKSSIYFGKGCGEADCAGNVRLSLNNTWVCQRWWAERKMGPLKV